MPRDPRAYLWDAQQAAGLLTEFSNGRTFTEYQADALLRSAIERQFEVVGEALNQLSRVAPEVAALIPDLPRIVAFRNILIHGYATVDDALVWQLLVDKLPALRQILRTLLNDDVDQSGSGATASPGS